MTQTAKKQDFRGNRSKIKTPAKKRALNTETPTPENKHSFSHLAGTFGGDSWEELLEMIAENRRQDALDAMK